MYSKNITVGRLTRDPEQKAAGQSTVTRFSVAFDDGYGDKKKTHFVNVAAWGKQGDSVMAYCKKGTIVIVEGVMISSKSNETTYWELRADSVKFLPSGDKPQGQAPQQQQYQQPQQPQAVQTPFVQQPQYAQQQPQFVQQPQYTQQVQQPQYDPNAFQGVQVSDDNLPF